MNNRYQTRTLLITGLLAILVIQSPVLHHPLPAFAGPDSQLNLGEEWKKEFDALTSMTQDAMALTPDKLRALIERCDKLKPVIEKLEESSGRVYLKRLEMARKMFMFILEYKKSQPL